MKALNFLIIVVTNSFIVTVAFLMLEVSIESSTANYKIVESWMNKAELSYIDSSFSDFINPSVPPVRNTVETTSSYANFSLK